MPRKSSTFLDLFGYDLLLGSIAAFYVFMVPYSKVEESFNIQAMHDILYHRHHLEKYDHFEFPGVVPRTFIGALLVSTLASPVVLMMNLLNLPKVYSLYAVRLVLGSIILWTLRFFRVQIRKKFGYQVEAFFVVLTALQFHTLFYCTRPLPNILAFALVNLAYGHWLRGNFYATLNCLIFAMIIFRCDMLLLISPLGLELLMTKSISLWKALKWSIGTALFCIGLTILVDSVMWQRVLWPEFEVFWFNSVLNRSSEWGTHPFHWYFTSALPRSLLAAYPLFLLGIFLDRRVLFYVLPVFSFVVLYSKLPHKELRFIIASLPIFNLSAAIAISRVYNNRSKSFWKFLYIGVMGSLLVSLGCTLITFLASYKNYPSGFALKALHTIGLLTVTIASDHTWNFRMVMMLECVYPITLGPVANNPNECWVHIDTFSAMNGISRFCEMGYPWRYSKEEGISRNDFQLRNFTYLVNEQSSIDGYKCLLSVDGFSRMRLQRSLPFISLVNEPKVFVHGNLRNTEILQSNWPGC